ncbi:MAG TPA: hypothetical protein VFG42_17575 [Baekduia sp.]|uniref:hypothetical protein n=1 Tax=Baekduia sp. TaxID=2600305 RepID=UPI002D78F4DD|nr:hypothetical protein [Baekduia sp.]HET6508607.1 hypothetical protein [Baekduia sp.]
MVAVTLSMMVLGLFAVGAWAAANGDQRPAGTDVDRKRAYEAAEAGLQWYAYQLSVDTNYWNKCGHDQDPTDIPDFVQNAGKRTAWRLVGGSDSDISQTTSTAQEQFAIELVPVNASKPCTASGQGGSTLLSDGVLTVRSTGSYRGKLRQVVGKFRRAGFLDYIWYTGLETAPPASYTASQTLTSDWAKSYCNKVRHLRDKNCTEIQFIAGDKINGPLHTEDDSLLVCGSPTFGRNNGDKLEVLGSTSASNAYKQNGTGCSGTPNWLGTLQYPPKQVDLPDTNSTIATVANQKYTGETCLQFNSNDTVNVYPNLLCTGTTSQSVSLTGDTTIWVGTKTGGTCTDYAYYQKYAANSDCGNVGVKGTYSKSITVAAANDIVVVGNLQHTGDGIMGLVANQFVRVYHPQTWTNNTNDCTGNTLTTAVTKIDAAILATTGSFMADNYYCGNDLGKLSVLGAIAQKWRGAVGQAYSQCDSKGRNCVASNHGYTKDYNYDDRLRYREPPNFLDPVTVNWNLLRSSEQSPVK